MTEIIDIYQTVFLPEFKTQAIIKNDGTIYIALINGYFMTKDEFTEICLKEDIFNDDMLERRLNLYDDLRYYYEENYRVQKESEKNNQ